MSLKCPLAPRRLAGETARNRGGKTTMMNDEKWTALHQAEDMAFRGAALRCHRPKTTARYARSRSPLLRRTWSPTRRLQEIALPGRYARPWRYAEAVGCSASTSSYIRIDLERLAQHRRLDRPGHYAVYTDAL